MFNVMFVVAETFAPVGSGGGGEGGGGRHKPPHRYTPYDQGVGGSGHYSDQHDGSGSGQDDERGSGGGYDMPPYYTGGAGSSNPWGKPPVVEHRPQPPNNRPDDIYVANNNDGYQSSAAGVDANSAVRMSASFFSTNRISAAIMTSLFAVLLLVLRVRH